VSVARFVYQFSKETNNRDVYENNEPISGKIIYTFCDLSSYNTFIVRIHTLNNQTGRKRSVIKGVSDGNRTDGGVAGTNLVIVRVKWAD